MSLSEIFGKDQYYDQSYLISSEAILCFHQENKSLLADDATIYSCSLNYQVAHQKLSNDTNIVSNWFRINSMAANPGRFHITLLGSSINNTQIISDNSIIFIVENKNLKNNIEVKLLEITIDHKLTFTQHISNSCNTASKRAKKPQNDKKFSLSRSVSQEPYLM